MRFGASKDLVKGSLDANPSPPFEGLHSWMRPALGNIVKGLFRGGASHQIEPLHESRLQEGVTSCNGSMPLGPRLLATARYLSTPRLRS